MPDNIEHVDFVKINELEKTSGADGFVAIGYESSSGEASTLPMKDIATKEQVRTDIAHSKRDLEASISTSSNTLETKIDSNKQATDKSIADNKTELEQKIANAELNRDNNKGIFSTLESLITTHPKADNKKDFFAFVGLSDPREKYIVLADNGFWTATGELHNVADVNMADYAKKENATGESVVYAQGGKIEVKDKTDKATIANVSQDHADRIFDKRIDARNATEYKGKGQLLVYKLKDVEVPISEIFIGDNIADWGNPDKWLEIPYVNPRKEKEEEVIPEEELIVPFTIPKPSAEEMTARTRFNQGNVVLEFSRYMINRELSRIHMFTRLTSTPTARLKANIVRWDEESKTYIVNRSYDLTLTNNETTWQWKDIIFPRGVVLRNNEYLQLNKIDAYIEKNNLIRHNPYVGGWGFYVTNSGWRFDGVDPLLEIYAYKGEIKEIIEEGNTRVPLKVDISDLGKQENYNSGKYPISISDESGNVVWAIDNIGKMWVGNMELPSTFTEVINAIVDKKLEELGEGSSTNNASYTYNDRDAKIVGIGRSRFCFIHVSDNHSSLRALQEVARIFKYYEGIIDDVIHSGDVIEGLVETGETFIGKIEQSRGFPNIMWALGNHDAEFANGDGTKMYQYNRMIKPFVDKWGIVYQEGKCYYYKDYPAYGIRVITLDIYDNADTNGGLSSPNMSNAQCLWLKDVLLDANNKKYAIIINKHDRGGSSYSHNGNFITDIVVAFKNGTTLSQTYSSKVGKEDLVIDVTFPNKGNFIMNLAGHIHADKVGSDAMGIYKTVTFSGNRWDQDFLERRSYTANAFDIVIVDLNSKKVMTFRIGAAYDKNYLQNGRNYAETLLDIV